MKYFSLFAGIGGFELGIQQASKETSHRTKDKIECVGYSEIDKYAIRVYENHFNHKNYGDIKTIKPKKLPNFDLLVGGFPCQPFSIAGQRKGFADTRGAVFFDIARILKSKKPRLVLLENVKGLLSHDNGNTFKTIITSLAKLGYDIQWQVLNSQNFGVPQHRERVFIVGHLRGTTRPEVFPFTENDSEDTVVSTITTRITADSNGTYICQRSPREIKGINQRDYVVKIKEATKKGYAEARVGQSINLTIPNSKTRRGRVSNIAQTLDTEMQQYTLTPDRMIRRLTPIECERLQGFPDGWTEEISDAQRYKCIGNAVTVNVVRKIARKLLSAKNF